MRGPITLLADSWNSFVSNWKLFFEILFVPAAVSVAASLFLEKNMVENLSIMERIANGAVFAVVMAITFLAGIAVIKAITAPKGMTVEGAYRYALKQFLPYFVIALLVGAVVLGGFIFLIIPGIVFAVWFSFAYFIFVTEGKRDTAALHASREYVRGRWWGVFGRIAFLVFVAMVVSLAITFVLAFVFEAAGANGEIGEIIASLIINIAFVPLAVAYNYGMYLDLKNQGA